MDDKITTIHITKTLTSSMIMELMDEYPNLEEITCSPSVYNRTSNNYIEALLQLDIKVKKKYNWGAKSQSNGLEFKVLELKNEGFRAHDISEKLNISLSRVYYLIKKTNETFDNRQRKHNHNEIKKLKDNGLSAKDISKKLDVPLRSVYYILNKK